MDASTVIEDILEHHGIKGMHWGIRRDRSGKVTVTNRKLSKRLKTTGGYGHPAHTDAVRTAELGQVKRKSGIKALSNEDLQTYTKRLNLEQNANRLDYETASVGRKYAMKFLNQAGSKGVEEASSGSAKLVKKGLKKAAVTAAAAA